MVAKVNKSKYRTTSFKLRPLSSPCKQRHSTSEHKLFSVQRIREEKREKKRFFFHFFDILESRGFGRDIFAFCCFQSVGGYILCILEFLKILYVVFFSPLLDRGERRYIKREIKKKV